MKNEIRFLLNGKPIEVRDVDPNITLLGWLRHSGMTGSKEGCAEGECGACAVALRSTGPDGRARYEAINSCLALLVQMHDRELITVEGVAPSESSLHPVQEVIAEGGGSQCGYCTPGFIVSLFAEYYRADSGPIEEESFSGNLCRCTGYRPIRDAAQKLATLRAKRSTADDAHRERLAEAVPRASSLSYASQPARRRFERPTRLSDALSILAAEPRFTPIAGGTDLVVPINQQHVRHERLLSLEHIAELRGITFTDRAIEIGAGESLASIEETLHGRVPLFDQLLPLFASRLIRTRATLGGNLATASPIGDSPPVLLALDAQVIIATRTGDRVVPIDQFFTGYRRTALLPGELLRGVRIPLPLPKIQRFYKVSKRRMDDISTVAAGFTLETDEDGIIGSARLAFGGVAATPVRAMNAEAALIGKTFDAEAIDAACALAMAALAPIGDHRGSAGYRKAMVGSLLRKFLAEEGRA